MFCDCFKTLISAKVVGLSPDNFHPKLLKSLSMSANFFMAVTDLVKACASTGTIPKLWKEAHIVSLYKTIDLSL